MFANDVQFAKFGKDFPAKILFYIVFQSSELPVVIEKFNQQLRVTLLQYISIVALVDSASW